MAWLMRPLRQLPQLQSHYCCRATFNHVLAPSLPLALATRSILHSLSCVCVVLPGSNRSIHQQSRGPGMANALIPSGLQEGDASDSDTDFKKSRNQKKREARRAVGWGMELASFSVPQIKRVLRVTSLDEDVFDALMLVKRLGPDVKEGKRRQFNYIGKLLREVEPELMDALIHATKVGDRQMLQALAGSKAELEAYDDDDDDDDDDDYDESKHMDNEDGEETSQEYISKVTRWFDGLISRDMKITNEVYSLHDVDFDRQELRKLVRKLQSVREQLQVTTEESEENINAAVMAAEKSLTRFLRALAKQMPSE